MAKCKSITKSVTLKTDEIQGWQKIELERLDDDQRHYKVNLFLSLDDSNIDTPLSVCTYAAISDEPSFNSRTKLLRINL